MIENLSVVTVSEAIADKIVELISSGQLKWGEKLPPQRELAKMLNVGVSSLREGLQILQTMGFIEIRRGHGTYITENSTKVLSKNITLSVYLDSNIRDLMETREVLEVGVAGLAAKRATQQDLKRMERCLTELDKIIEKDDEEVSRYDLEFHIALAESTKNALLIKFARAIRSSLKEFIGNIEHTKRGLQYHWKVYEAVRDRNPEAAREAMSSLLKITEKTYLSTKRKEKNR